MVVTGTYNPYLVALSVLVACFASYTALDLGGRLGTARGPSRRMWLAAAAITLGGGIWSMHFIGMLAFVMPMPMSYDIGLTALSLVVAILVTFAGFYVISRHNASPLRLMLSGAFMGLGIIAMHYTGMAAIRGNAEVSYDRLFVGLSVAIAIGAATAALWLAFRNTSSAQKVVAAIVMGIAISGMHYTGMRAAIFHAHMEAAENASLDPTNLALSIAGITFVILAAVLFASLSEQTRAQEALRQARSDLAHVNRLTTMGELTAALTHEVSQPIAAAVTHAEACVRWLARDPPNLDEAREAAEMIVKHGMVAGEIVGRIRLLFKKDTPQQQLVDVNEVIREMVVLLHGEVTRFSITVRTELAKDLPYIMADRVQLQQVMMNLIINGIEAMKDADGIRELAIKSQREQPDQLIVCVSDTGVGLPPKQADQIFNTFFTTKPNGTGMGLSICRSIVESHGGRLWATDNIPHGANFHFVLARSGAQDSVSPVTQ
jgi:NO-binding membrane sensor protein with MHYT domain